MEDTQRYAGNCLTALFKKKKKVYVCVCVCIYEIFINTKDVYIQLINNDKLYNMLYHKSNVTN